MFEIGNTLQVGRDLGSQNIGTRVRDKVLKIFELRLPEITKLTFTQLCKYCMPLLPKQQTLQIDNLPLTININRIAQPKLDKPIDIGKDAELEHTYTNGTVKVSLTNKPTLERSSIDPYAPNSTPPMEVDTPLHTKNPNT